MSVWRLVFREISHRKLNFTLALVSVAAAVACLVGAQAVLRADRIVTDRILASKQQELERAVAEKREAVERAGAELEDAMRRHMLGLGFNVLILPEQQDLAELHLNGTLSTAMPEEYVHRLANSKIITVNHLLPSVTRRIHWPEREMDIILYGTRGEVPIMHRGLKKPLLEAVAPGKLVLGHEIHRKLGLQVGDEVTLLGTEFTVSRVHPQRGSTDDVTVWIDLRQAQELLGMQNLVNAILALECECAGDRISQVRQEIAAILPGTKVIERYSQALARAEARTAAKETAETALADAERRGTADLAREERGRFELESQHAELAGVIVPLVIAGAAVWIGLLAFGNARQRSGEIGILRAIGVGSRQVMLLFLTKAALIGLAGGVLGAIAGLAVGLSAGGLPATRETWRQLLATGALPTTLALAPLLALALASLASWVPAFWAARQDPAVILQGD
jgi:putative ABC transport system permease protein